MADLPVGETVSATLDSSDCKFSDINGGTLGSLVKRYRIRVAEPRALILGMSATGFTPQLLIYAAQNRLVGTTSGAAPGAAAVRLAIHLTPGEYTIFAMANRADVTGTLELKSELEPLRTCPTGQQTLTLDGTVEGNFDASTCRFLDLTPLSTNEAHVVFYRATMPRAAVLDLQAQTAMTGFSMVLTNDALAAFRGTQSILASLNPGALLFSVSSSNRGSYSIKSAVTDRRACNQAPIQNGEEVSIELALAGCRVLDYRVPSSDARPLALYRFSVADSTIVEINQKAPVLDTLLYLFDSRATVISLSDDAFENSTDSKILIHLPPGGYVIGASTFDRATPGSATLKLAGDRPRSCEAPLLSANEAVMGRIPESGCRYLDYVAFSEDEALVSPYSVEPDQKRLLKFTVSGLTRGFVEVASPQAVLLAGASADRDGDASPEMLFLPGKHFLLLSSEAGDGVRPEFSVRMTARDLPACDTGVLPANGEVTEVLTAVECKASEIVPYLALPVSAKAFKLDLPSRGRVAITVDSSAFAPLLAILQGPDNRLLAIGRQTPGPVTASGTLASGDYRIVAGTLSSLGEYKLKIEFTPEGAPSTSGVGPIEFGVRTADVVGVHQGRVGGEPGEIAVSGEIRHRARQFVRRSNKERQ